MTTGGKIAETVEAAAGSQWGGVTSSVASRTAVMIKAMMAMALRDNTTVEGKTIETMEEDVAIIKAMATKDMVAAAAMVMSEAQGARPWPVGTQATVVAEVEEDHPVATTLGTVAADKAEVASAGQQVAPMEAAMAGLVMAGMTLSALVLATTILAATPMVEAAWVAPVAPTK